MDDALVEAVCVRDPRAVARALSLVIDEEPDAADLLRRLQPRVGRAYLIGVTGAPGAGKSTLVDRVIAAYRRRGSAVGVLAVDPSSPFTGGAVLGDRVRMQAHASDADVFIRSLATRGHLGGLARATGNAAAVLDAAGFDVVLIETVGVGQDEIDIAALADVTVIVTAPGGGDDVQALKAGLMEVGDIFVINKADLAGADRARTVVQTAVAFRPARRDGWTPAVIETVATEDTGTELLMGALEQYRRVAMEDRSGGRRERAMSATVPPPRATVRERTPPNATETLARDASAEWDDVRRALEAGPGAVPAGMPSTIRLDHVGMAVGDATVMRAFFEEQLGLKASAPEDVVDQGVRVQFLGGGPVPLELVSPLAEASALSGFLERRGPGLHHVAFQVRDLSTWIARLTAAGVRLVDSAPRPGAHGGSVVFVHPSSTGGVLVELVEKEPHHENR